MESDSYHQRIYLINICISLFTPNIIWMYNEHTMPCAEANLKHLDQDIVRLRQSDIVVAMNLLTSDLRKKCDATDDESERKVYIEQICCVNNVKLRYLKQMLEFYISSTYDWDGSAQRVFESDEIRAFINERQHSS
ncbi:MAG: hypothetical protein BWY45_02762 [Euryarchaeota archaeon ADurb.Bin294]|nr:MAG: hypothetical protein BWY45_02762 [Euryarchaeota archaeon ADurb.Bin294]